ncbi:MAG: hypothetical protein A2Y76_11565 [Planctomycetes bacterium RBG_13_60_9]|nr:MAG: hypothetical protein A2Y76_11565 [Planctomycetes bacterium RBG_13_60_9]
MRVLLLFPGELSKLYNDNVYSYIAVQKSGAEILAICGRRSSTKKGEPVPERENIDGMAVERLFHDAADMKRSWRQKYTEIHDLTCTFKPDIIFCSQQSNMPLAIRLRREFSIPLILLVESAYNPEKPFLFVGPRRAMRSRFIATVLGRLHWRWLCYHSTSIITCNHGDVQNGRIVNTCGTPITYVPWPSHRSVNSACTEKARHQATFIGAFSDHKNMNEFEVTIPRILSALPSLTFVFVGDGKHRGVVVELQRKYPKQISWIISMSRNDCLRLIAGSYFAYSPAVYGGWGFIGDAWAMKTPLVATCNHYGFHDGDDCVLTTADSIVTRIQELYADAQMYQRIQRNGYRRFRLQHDASQVGMKYYEVIRGTLQNQQ